MLTKRTTISEIAFPRDEFESTVTPLLEKATDHMCSLIWAGYDALKADILSKINVSDAEDDIERDVTELLHMHVCMKMPVGLPFTFVHGPFERDTRKPAPAQPPQYDLGFRLNRNMRLIWPLEAKVLRTDGDVSQYVADVKGEFLQCRYAPLSKSGGMLGYLLCGSSAKALSSIASSLGCPLQQNKTFPTRPHACSFHNRLSPPCHVLATDFTCHHLILEMV